MKVDITKLTQNITAINKKTGEKKDISLLHIGQRKFYCPDDGWGIWHDYSKRGKWIIELRIPDEN